MILEELGWNLERAARFTSCADRGFVPARVATGFIAAKYLKPQAAAAVKDLLGDESLAGVSTWPDEIRRELAPKAAFCVEPRTLSMRCFYTKHKE